MTETMRCPRVLTLVSMLAVITLGGCQDRSSTDTGEVPEATQSASQGAAAAVTEADIGMAETWGGVDNVVSVKHLYFSAQPDLAALQVAREHDVGVVIDLREPSESQWDEAAAAEKLGMQYFNLPVPAVGSSLDTESMQAISNLVRQNHDQKILLHCSSGNRASAWLAVHLAVDHGMEAESSISLAQKSGLNKSEMEQRVRTYLTNGTGRDL